MSEPAACPTVVLRDAPAAFDAVGGHDRIAELLCNRIASDTTAHCIALVGPWGSGKSTVIELAKTKLKSISGLDVFVWTFDAWAHEGQALRRSVLENLGDALAENGWIERGSWQARKTSLRVRQTSTSGETRPRPSVPLLGFIIGAACLPPLLDAAWPTGATRPHWLIAVLALLFIVSLVLVLWPVLRRGMGGGSEIRSAWATALTLAPDQESKSIAITPTEPGSIEIVEGYEAILEEALSDERRRLVIVFDNVDRLSSDEARAALAMLQLYASPGLGVGAAGRAWYIIPTEPSRFREVADSGESVPAPVTGLDEHGVLDKLCQVWIRVPPPVHARWQKLTHRLCREAFPNHPETELEAVVGLVNAMARDRDLMPPTPRTLVHIVNDVGALHERHCGKISLAHIAYFVLCTRAGQNVVKDLAIPGALYHARVAGYLREDSLLRDIAVLTYELPPREALHAAFAGPIADALRSGSGTYLKKELREVAEVGAVLLDVLNDAIRGWATNPSAADGLVLAAAALWDAELLRKSGGAVAIQCRTRLRRASRFAIEVSNYRPEIARGFLALANIAESKGDAAAVASLVRRLVYRITAGGSSIAVRAAFAPELMQFTKLMRGRGFGEALEDGADAGGTPDDWHEWLGCAARAGAAADDPIWEYLRPTFDTDQGRKFYEGAADAGKWNPAIARGWRVYRKYHVPESAVRRVNSALLARLSSSSAKRLDAGVAAAVLTLSEPNKEEGLPDALLEMAGRGGLTHLWANLDSDQDAAGMAAVAYAARRISVRHPDLLRTRPKPYDQDGPLISPDATSVPQWARDEFDLLCGELGDPQLY